MANRVQQLVIPKLRNATVLLTGSTGYLGSFILHELLQYNCTVYCLIRGKDEQHCRLKLATQMHHHLLPLSDADQIKVIQGDLNELKFGLSDALYDQLSNVVDVVIHNGALVHWVYPYDKLYKPNVQSTMEAYKLCCLNKLKRFIFVSSTSVISGNMDAVDEEDTLIQCKTGIKSGYGQTKWVCERVLQHALLPVNVIRPGYIVGHGKNGVTNSDDFIFRMIKGCQELKYAPIINNHINMCTVDYVSKVVVGSLLLSDSCHYKVYQTWQPIKFTFTELFGICAHYMNIKPIEYSEWKLMLQTNVNDALMPLLHFVMDDLPTTTKGCLLKDDNTRHLIKEVHSQYGILIENTSMQKSIRWMIGYLIDVGYLQKDLETMGDEWKTFVNVPFEELPKLDMWKQSKTMVKRSNQ